MFVCILLRDPARDFGVEFESLRHRKIFGNKRARGQKTIGSHLKDMPTVMNPVRIASSDWKPYKCYGL